MGLVPGVNTRPLIWEVPSARSADAREASFLVELYIIYLPWKGVLVFEHTAEKAVFRHRRDGVEGKGGRGRWRIRVDLRLCTPVYMPLVHSLTHISRSII